MKSQTIIGKVAIYSLHHLLSNYLSNHNIPHSSTGKVSTNQTVLNLLGLKLDLGVVWGGLLKNCSMKKYLKHFFSRKSLKEKSSNCLLQIIFLQVSNFFSSFWKKCFILAYFILHASYLHMPLFHRYGCEL